MVSSVRIFFSGTVQALSGSLDLECNQGFAACSKSSVLTLMKGCYNCRLRPTSLKIFLIWLVVLNHLGSCFFCLVFSVVFLLVLLS